MTETLIETTDSFTVKLSNSNQVGVIDLINVNALYQQYIDLNQTYLTGFKFFLEDLQATINLTNGGLNTGLKIAGLPNIGAEDTNAEKEIKNQEVLAVSEKIGLRFHKMRVGDNLGWQKISEAPLTNNGFELQRPLLNPYFTLKPIKLLGSFDRLGVEIINYGNGVLRANDFILIEGSYTFELSGTKKTNQSITPISFNTIIYPDQTEILAQNPLRRGLIIHNNGSTTVWIAFDTFAQPGNGIPILPNGSFTFNESDFRLTTSIIGIVVEGEALITGVEYI